MKKNELINNETIPCAFAKNGDTQEITWDDTTPSLENIASYNSGFYERTQEPLPTDGDAGGTGIPINRTTFNKLFNVLTNFTFNHQMGFQDTKWSMEVATALNGYPKDAVVYINSQDDLDNGKYTKYRSLVDDNMVNPVNDNGANWIRINNSENANKDLSNLTQTGLANVNVFRKQVEMQPINSIGKILTSGNYITLKAGSELIFNNGVDSNTGFCNNIIIKLENDITREMDFIAGDGTFILYALLDNNNNITLNLCRYELFHEIVDNDELLTQSPTDGTILVDKGQNLAYIYTNNHWVNMQISKLGRVIFSNSSISEVRVDNLISGLGVNDIHFLGGLSFPSNTRIELASNFVNTSVTIGRDGYAYVSMTNASYCRIIIDNVFANNWDYSDRSRGANISIPVKRGMTVRVESNTDNPSNSHLYLILAQHEVI